MSGGATTWPEDLAAAEWRDADDLDRFGIAARMAACGAPGEWRARVVGQGAEADPESVLVALADRVGARLTAACMARGRALGEAILAAQDVALAASSLIGETGADDLTVTARCAVEACLDAAEELALDDEAVDLIEAWPWRRLLPEEGLLGTVADPTTEAEALAVIAATASTADGTGSTGDAGAELAAIAEECSRAVARIKQLEGEELREHLQDAWRWAHSDKPLFQLTWLLEDRRRSAEDRIWAINALARWGHPFGWHLIVRHADRAFQSDSEIRLRACLALSQAGRVGLPRLEATVRDATEDRPVRLAAARALLILTDDPVAQELAAEVGTTDREDRRLRAVAAVARGDREALARLSLDGYGAPELPRWGLSAIDDRGLPSQAELVARLRRPHHREAATFLALSGWSVRAPSALRAAVEAALAAVRREGCYAGALLYRAAACLHDRAVDLWADWPIADPCRERDRVAITRGLAGDASVDSLHGFLRVADGHRGLIAAIGDRKRDLGERDLAVLLLVLHRRLHPAAEPDWKALRKALQRCVRSADDSSAAAESAERGLARRCAWAAATLRVPGSEDLVAATKPYNDFATWGLSQFDTDRAREHLREIAERVSGGLSELGERERRSRLTPLYFALTDRRVDAGPGILRPEMADDDGFWRYVIMRGAGTERDLLDRAPPWASIAYRLSQGEDGDEETASAPREVLLQAWRHLEAIERYDLAVPLLPGLHEHDPTLCQDRLARLGDLLTAEAAPRVARTQARTADPWLRFALAGLKAALATDRIQLPDELERGLRYEEGVHLRFAGRQLAADEGTARGAGVVELAKTMEVACRHHLAPRIAEPLTRLASQRADASVVRRSLRRELDECGLQGIQNNCFDRALPKVLQNAVDGGLTKPRPGLNQSLGYWATALALARPPSRSPEPIRRALDVMWRLQQRRNDLVHDLGEVEEPEAKETWRSGIGAMPVVVLN